MAARPEVPRPDALSPETELVVFLHGMGQSPADWDAQLAGLPPGYRGIAPRLFGGGRAGAAGQGSIRRGATMHGAAEAVVARVEAEGAHRIHLCGLSLGAVVATRVAIDHPESVASLVLSGGQVRPNPVLMRLQRALTRLGGSRMAASLGMSHEDLLALLDDVAGMDLRPELQRISAPTLVLCGGRDRANLPAARALAAGIDGASLHVIPKAGHAWNARQPGLFNEVLARFLARVAGR